MEHEISIIIPVYDTSPELIEKSLASCLNQSFRDIEVVIVDDGSSNEATVSCLDEIEARKMDVDVVVRHIPNGGVSAARMEGAGTATGKYITFLDSDDMLHSSFCERMYHVLKATDSDMVACGNFCFSGDGECDGLLSASEEAKEVCTYEKAENLAGGIFGATKAPAFYTLWAKLMRRDIFLDTCSIYKDIARGEDMVTVFEYLTACNKIAVIKDKLYFYNEGNEDSVTKKADARQMTVALAWIAMYDIICDRGYESLREPAAVKTIGAIIDAISGAGKNRGAEKVYYYASQIKRFHKYFSLLSHSNRVKAVIIMRTPFIYRLLARIRQRG